MDASAREFVRRRAKHRCEYCLLRQEHSGSPHQIEHIVARQHGGSDRLDNLALACDRCNLKKGPNLSGLDPVGDTRAFVSSKTRRLGRTLSVSGAYIEGLTPTGRATVQVLDMNDARRLDLRAEILSELN